jgi:hypothetical protein
MIKTFAGLSAAFLLAGGAVAQEVAPVVCPAVSPPTVERPVKPTRPPVPSCVNEARGTHNCRNNVLRDYEAAMTRYQAEFSAHVAELNAYMRKLENYTRDAIAYAECERRVVMPSTIITG